MGYSTDFTGILKFTCLLTVEAFEYLQTFIGEDCREHPEWGNTELTWIDLNLTQDGKGIIWDRSEKTYNLVEKINLIIRMMRKKYPDFGLEGSMIANGEDSDDNWKLIINKDGWAEEVTLVLSEEIITCPHCKKEFQISTE